MRVNNRVPADNNIAKGEVTESPKKTATSLGSTSSHYVASAKPNHSEDMYKVKPQHQRKADEYAKITVEESNVEPGTYEVRVVRMGSMIAVKISEIDIEKPVELSPDTFPDIKTWIDNIKQSHQDDKSIASGVYVTKVKVQ